MNLKFDRLQTAAALLAVLALSAFGCSKREPDSAPPAAPSDPASVSTPATPRPNATGQSAKSGAPPEGGTWYVCLIGGSRVGYERSALTEFTRDGRKLLRVERLSHMAIKRSGQEIELDVQFTSIETPDGRLIEFDGELSQGPMPMRMAGRVAGDVLKIETTTKGKTETSSIPWSAEYGGFMAVEQSLARKPIEPGEKRTIHALLPGFNVLGTTELVARGYEPVKLPTGTHDLLRIDTSTTFPTGPPLAGGTWTDRTGEVLRSRLEAMEIESFRATRAEALEETGPVEIDLVHDVKVEVARPLPSPHQTKRVRYRVSLDGGDPASVFVTGPSQEVKSIDPHAAEVTVFAIRPDDPAGNPHAVDDPPTADDLQPNNLIQSDYPAIVAKAGQTAADKKNPWPAAVALEQCAADTITRPGYSQAFATAADVIDSGEGDCTEHAVLLAALCRARKIPARVAIGLVYIDQAFYYHMWTEVHVEGRWTPLDATRPHGGTGAAYLKMAHSNLHGGSALSSFLPVLEVIGRLKIEILEVE
ncbi:MAG: transglutaminase family protein [Planctomycetota bacterium]